MEEHKFGVAPKYPINLIKQIATFENIKIKGSMTIGLFSNEIEKICNCFQSLKKLQQEIIKSDMPQVQMIELSMGMSGDYTIAIAEGASIIRISTTIFGKSAQPDSYYWNEHR